MRGQLRIGLGVVCVAAAIGLLIALISDGWYYAQDELARMFPEHPRVRWSGFSGPYSSSDESTLNYVGSVVAGLATMFVIPCALLLGLGAIAGARRNHVPRLAASLSAVFGLAAVAGQALAMTTWPYDEQLEPRGFGWSMPLYFVMGLALTVAATVLWIDARKRARASAEQLAAIEREQTASDLAAFPELAAEVADPIERL